MEKRFVAAESFTGGGYDAPAAYKNLADYWFAQGVNRIVFHSSAHQPLDTKPGNTMVGTHFNRNITWAEQAEAGRDISGAHFVYASAGALRGGLSPIC